MHDHVPLDQVAYSNRWADRHPMEKAWLSGGLLLIACAMPPLPAAPLVLSVTTGFALLAARVPGRTWISMLGAQAVFLALALAPVFWQSGWELGIRTGLRSLAATSALLLLALTTPMPVLLGWIGRWRPLEPLAELAALIYRFLATGLSCVYRGRSAWRLRGRGSGLGLRWRVQSQLAARVLNRLVAKAGRMDYGYQVRGVPALLPAYRGWQPCNRHFVIQATALLAAIAAIGGGWR